jgi:DNA-binding MarR family transcriptional regulator
MKPLATEPAADGPATPVPPADVLAGAPMGRLLAVAGRLVSAAFARALEEHGLTPAGLAVLDVLAETDGISASQVADACHVRPATITGVVDTLERAGWVARERDNQDRRLVRIRVTDAGRALQEAARAAASREIAPLLPPLNAADEDVVRNYLSRVVEGLRERVDVRD